MVKVGWVTKVEIMYIVIYIGKYNQMSDYRSLRAEQLPVLALTCGY